MQAAWRTVVPPPHIKGRGGGMATENFKGKVKEAGRRAVQSKRMLSLINKMFSETGKKNGTQEVQETKLN